MLRAVLEFGLESRLIGEKRFCTETSRPSSTSWAISIWATLALEMPAMRMTPSSSRSRMAVTDSR